MSTSHENRPHKGLLPPRLDIVFRALFGRETNTDMLASLLNGILELSGAEAIVEVRLLSPLNEVEAGDDKEGVVDIAVRDAKGRRFVVEMQCRNHQAFPERMLYYAARRFGEQLRAGDGYDRLEAVVLVIFADFVMMPEYEAWRERFELRGTATAAKFSDHLSVVLVELPKFTKRPTEARSLGEQWVAFLKEGEVMESQLDEPWVTPELRKAREELERLSGDERERARFEARLRQVQIWSTELHDTYMRAREDVARQFLADGDSPERVARVTGLPLDKVRSLAG